MVTGGANARPLRIAPIFIGLLVAVLGCFISDGRVGTRSLPTAVANAPHDCPVFVAASVDGSAISGARLELERRSVRAYSDAEGRARLPDEANDILRVSAYGFARRRIELDAETLRVDSVLRVDLDPGIAVFGTIVDELGQPVADAAIEAGFDDDPNEPPVLGRTDANGRFVIDFLRPGRWLVTATAPRHDSSSRVLVLTTGRPQTPERFVLAPTGMIDVHVASPSGDDVSGAEVEVGGVGFPEPLRATSDASGVAHFDAVARGVYEVRATFESLTSRRVSGVNVDAGRTTRVDVTLEESRPISGRIVEGNDTPVEGAEIILTEDALDLLPRMQTSLADGTFAFAAVPNHPLVLVVRQEGYIPFGPVIVIPGEPLPTITLVRAGTIRGRVLDSNGQPVVGAVVTLVDARGAARAASPSTGTPAPALPLAAPTGEPTALFQAAGELGVTLGDIPPIPLANIAATPTASALGPSVASVTLGSVTDRRGEFILVGVPPGTVQIAAFHPAHPTATSEPRHLGSGETIEGWDLTFAAAGRLLVRVVDARNRPLGGVPVELRTDADDVPRTAVTDYDGRTAFDGVSGIAVVTAMPYGRAAARARIEVRLGAEVEVEVALEDARFSLEGRVVDTRGVPIEGARIGVVSTRTRALLDATAMSEPDGTFRFDALPAPPYRISVEHAAYADYRRDDVRPINGRIEIRLEVGGVIVGLVVDADDESALARVEVSLRRDDVQIDADASDEQGRFSFERVPPGRYVLEFSSRDHLPFERPITLAPSRFDPPRLDVGRVELSGAFVIRGRVTDALGDPVPRARISLPSLADSPTSTTDRGGVFELRGVSPGTYELVAEHVRAGLARARRPVRGEAREIVSDIEVRLPNRLLVDDRTIDPALVRGVAMTLRVRGSAVVVDWLAPGGTAEAAGLQVDDRLISVDGEEASEIHAAEGMLLGPTGIPAELVVRRGPATRRFQPMREIYRPPAADAHASR